jgi:hypothetical protein
VDYLGNNMMPEHYASTSPYTSSMGAYGTIPTKYNSIDVGFNQFLMNQGVSPNVSDPNTLMAQKMTD